MIDGELQRLLNEQARLGIEVGMLKRRDERHPAPEQALLLAELPRFLGDIQIVREAYRLRYDLPR